VKSIDHPTLADITIWGYLKNNQVVIDQEQHPAIAKWLDHLAGIKQFQGVHKEAKKEKPTNEKKAVNLGAKGALEIKFDVSEGSTVCTRFPPEPSGYLHIGHMKAALLNSYYSTKYNGKLILRFDDTNPSKEKDIFVQNIIQDLATIQIIPDLISNTSDHFDLILNYGRKLLETGKGYMDATPKEQMKLERGQAIESKYRNTSIEENLRIWDNEFVKATEEGQKYALRGKIDMNSLTKSLRDPNFFRYNPTPHHKTGTKYKVYPLYDFACPIVDSIEGVTHALRSFEYLDRNDLYEWVLQALNLRKINTEYFSRLSFKHTVLSKRKLQFFVDNNRVSGWNDPSFPTIQGILRRGMMLEPLKEFILSLGASKVASNMDMDKLWAINKKFMDPIVPRYTALPKDKCCKFTLSNGPTTVEFKSVPLHKKNPDLGVKVVNYYHEIFVDRDDANGFTDNEEITLMDWGNAIIRQIVKDPNGQVSEVFGELHLEGDYKTTKKKLTWLSNLPNELIPIVIHDYDNLMTKDKLEEDEKFENFVNPVIHTTLDAVGDPNMKILNKGDRLQLERTGYFIVDAPLSLKSSLHLITIPDGKTTAVYKRG
jgi:glutamyl-tRNA synthetase